MITFLKKYKGRILYGLVLAWAFFYFVPVQENYYLQGDITDFNRQRLIPFLIAAATLTVVIISGYTFLKTRSFKQSGSTLLNSILVFGFAIFFLKSVFLGTALFINRQFEFGITEKYYKVSYFSGGESNKNNLIISDLSTDKIDPEPKLKGLYSIDLAPGDTLTLRQKKGLFGVAYQGEPFRAEP